MDLLQECEEFLYAMDEYRCGGLLKKGAQLAEDRFRKAVSDTKNNNPLNSERAKDT